MMEKHMDTSLSPKERAKLLLKQLSSEEKLGQLTGWMPPRDVTVDDINQNCRKGIGQISTLEMRCMETLEEAAAWQRRIQTQIIENSPHHIPAIFHMEGVCGAFLQGASSFPCNMARGAGWDPALEEKIARIVSRQERAVGITQTLAPVLDIAHDPRLGRHAEAYSEDPSLAAALGVAYTKGIQSRDDMDTCTDGVAKHFLASHHVTGGVHGTHADVPIRTLTELYGKPFQAAFTMAGLKGVMPCYCVWDGEPVSLSYRIMTNLMRTEMGFDGVTVSDYGAVSNAHFFQRAAETKSAAGLRALMNGMDVELPNAECFTSDIIAKAKGDPDVARRLDEAVLRVLTAKFRMGLFEHPFALEGKELKESFHRTEDATISSQAAQQGIVMLKNNGVLPIKSTVRRIAMIGCHANNARAFFGDYTHLSMASAVLAVKNSIAGIGDKATKGNNSAKLYPGSPVQSDETREFAEILQRQKPAQASLLSALRAAMPDCKIVYSYGYAPHGSDESSFEDALEAIRCSDIAILTLGGRYQSCSIATTGEGVDAANINLPASQERFIREAAKLHKPLVGVHFDGRPVSSDAADEDLSALLEVWTLAEGGARAVTDVLIGVVNPSGKLPVTVARNAGQIPVYYNHPWGSSWHQGESIGFPNYVDMPHAPRYHFGYGLSYTSFTYSDLTISAGETAPDKAVIIGCTIKNSGLIPGTEIAQLYLSDHYATMVRPVKELAGFARVVLLPGESQRVTWTFHPSQTAFLDRNMNWLVEEGEIELQVGASSTDIRLQQKIKITENAIINGRTRSFWAEADVQPIYERR